MTEPAADVGAILGSPVLLEALAAAEHERWSRWQQYLHDQCTPAADGSLIIPADLVARWSRQIESAYVDLSEQEKESDRDQVRSYLPIVVRALTLDGRPGD